MRRGGGEDRGRGSGRGKNLFCNPGEEISRAEGMKGMGGEGLPGLRKGAMQSRKGATHKECKGILSLELVESNRKKVVRCNRRKRKTKGGQ